MIIETQCIFEQTPKGWYDYRKTIAKKSNPEGV